MHTRWWRFLAARDPGRVRLVNASAVTLGVLASVLLGSVLVHALHESMGMLSLSLFLSVQAGNLAKGQNARARLLTTALLVPAAVGAILFATAADSIRPLAIACFVAMAGLTVWARRWGQRASALSSIAFFGYFFTLFMHPAGDKVVTFVLLVVCAIVPQILVRWVLLLRRPRREIHVLFDELRAALLETVLVALRSQRNEQIRIPLARADEVARAVTSWQDRYSTEQYLGCSRAEFENRVLDARVDTEEVAAELTRRTAAQGDHADRSRALAELQTVLERSSSAHEIAAAVRWARCAEPTGPLDALIASAVLSQAKLRETSFVRGQAQPPAASASASLALVSVPAASKCSHREAETGRRCWLHWREWSAPDRMTVQVMIAAAVASGVGEAISASRWYWAVLTAFVIFIGSGTRGDILTRAMRRIWGTFGGLLLGGLAVAVSGDATWVLVLVAVCAVFCMLYFGPLNYVYSALSITTMLVVMYRMLGVLDTQLLELRLVETLTGAAIGVFSAYFILSSSSKPALAAQVTLYLDALERVLQEALEVLRDPDQRLELVATLHALEACEADADHTVSGMSAAFALRSGSRESDTVHLMYVATRAAARLTQSVQAVAYAEEAPSAEPGPIAGTEEVRARDAISEGLRIVLQNVHRTRAALLGQSHADATPPDAPAVLTILRSGALEPSSAGAAAVRALARINWALQRAERGDMAGRGQ